MINLELSEGDAKSLFLILMKADILIGWELRESAKKAGINKKFNPQTHRHSRATHLANHLAKYPELVDVFRHLVGEKK